jgi:hypothetical protein
MNTPKKDLVKKYQNSKLAKTVYDKNIFYEVENFLDTNELLYILYEVWESDAYLTPKGISFLEEYYGFNKIVDLIINDGGELASKDKDQLLHWLSVCKSISE